MRSTTKFAVVSRDRLRFHVDIMHKWEEFTDPRGWRVRLVDDWGRVFRPQTVDVWSRDHVTRMWDFARVTVVPNPFDDLDHRASDGVGNLIFLESMTVFQGKGDYTFRGEILRPDTKTLMLEMTRDHVVYQFHWEFEPSSI